MAASSSLHPPRLAATFAGTPSAPGTPVHSIQSMRRKAAGHSGPLTKILVANRGVRTVSFLFEFIALLKFLMARKSLSVYSELLMN